MDYNFGRTPRTKIFKSTNGNSSLHSKYENLIFLVVKSLPTSWNRVVVLTAVILPSTTVIDS